MNMRQETYHNELVVGLCEGRHQMPVSNYLFPQVVANPCDPQSLYETASAGIPAGTETLRLYVSGLTQALTATVRACMDRQIGLVLMHYDRDKDSDYEEPMLSYEH